MTRTNKSALAIEDVRKFFAERMSSNSSATVTLQQWERMKAPARAKFQQQSFVEHQQRERDAIADAAERFRIAADRVRAIVYPAPVAEHWLVASTTPADVARRADVVLSANPNRAGASDWRQASQMASIAMDAIAQGDAEGAAWAAIQMMQKATRAELLEGPLPMILELRNRPRKTGASARGKPKPNRKKPLRNALEILAKTHSGNDDVLRELSDADAISARVRNDGFPIEVCDPKTDVKQDGKLKFYLPGGDSDSPQEKSVMDLRKILSEIRKQFSLSALD